MATPKSLISNQELREYATEHGTVAAVQMLLQRQHGITSFTDQNAGDHLFFSFSTRDDRGVWGNNYAGIEIHGYEDRATVEAGARLFKNYSYYGNDNTPQYAEDEYNTSGLRYVADTLSAARRGSSRASDLHERFQDLSSANIQGYIGHTPSNMPMTNMYTDMNDRPSHYNENLGNAALETTQLRKTAGMSSAAWEAAISHVTRATDSVAGVNFGTSETESTWESVTNITPLSSLGTVESAKFKSNKSSVMRQGMPMGNEGMPGTGTFDVGFTQYRWGRLEVGTMPNTPGGGMVMAQEPYAVRQRKIKEKLSVGELGALNITIQAGEANVTIPAHDKTFSGVDSVTDKPWSFVQHKEEAEETVSTGQRFYGQNVKLGHIAGGRSVTNDLGGASYTTVTGLQLAIGYGQEVVQSLQGVPGLEGFHAMIQEGFGLSTVDPREGLDDAERAKQQAALDLRNKARNTVLNAFALTKVGSQFGRENITYAPNTDINIVTFMDSFVPASIKGHGMKAGITMIDLELGSRGIMGKVEPSSIKLPHLMREQDQLYYANRYRGMDHPDVGNATEIEQKEFNIAKRYNALQQGDKKLSPDEAYQAIMDDVMELGIIHRVTRANEFLVPEERANAGRLSSMDLITMYRTGGDGMKRFVKGMISGGADAETGSIFASLFDLGGVNIEPLNIPVNAPLSEIYNALQDQGVDIDSTFKIGGRTMPSMRAIGDQGPAYAAVRAVLAAGTEEGAITAASEALKVIDRVYTQGDSSAKRITEIKSPNLGGRLRYWDAEDEMFTGNGRSQYDVYIGQKEVQRIAENKNVSIAEVEELIKSGKLMTALGGYPNKGALAMGRLNLANEANGFQQGMYEELEFSVTSSMLSVLFQRDNDYDFGPQPVGLTSVEGHAAAVEGSEQAFNEQAPLALRALEAMGAMVGPGPIAAKRRELIAAGVVNPTHMQVLFGSTEHDVTGLEAGVLRDNNGRYINENVPVKNMGVDESGIPLTADAGDATNPEGFYHRLAYVQRPEQNAATNAAVINSSESVNAGRRQAPVYGMTKQLGLAFAGMSPEERKKYNAVARANNPEWNESGIDPYRTGTQTYEGPYQVTVDFHTLPDNVREAYQKLYYSNGMADANGNAEDPIQVAGILARSLYTLEYVNREALAFSIGGTEHMQEVLDAFRNNPHPDQLPGSVNKLLPDSQFFKIAKMNQAVNFFQDKLEGKFDNLTPAQKQTIDSVSDSHLKFINSNRDLLEGLMAARRGGTPFSLYGTPQITGDIMGTIIRQSLDAGGATETEPGRTPAQQIRNKAEGQTIGINAGDDVVDVLRQNAKKYYSASAVGALAGMGPYADSNAVTYILNEMGKGNAALVWNNENESKGAALENAVDKFEPNADLNPFGNSVMSKLDIDEWKKSHPEEAPINMFGPIAKDSFNTSWLPDYIKYDTDDPNHTITFTDLKSSRREDAMKNFDAYKVQQSAYVYRTVDAARNGEVMVDKDGKISYTKGSGKENLFRSLVHYAKFTEQRAHEFIADVDKNGASMFKVQLYTNNNSSDIHLNDPDHMTDHIIPMEVMSGTALIDVFQQAQDRLVAIATGRDSSQGALLADANRTAAQLESGTTEVDVHGTALKTTGGDSAADAWSRVKARIDSQTEKNKQTNATRESVGGGNGNGTTGGNGGEARGGAPGGGSGIPGGFSFDDFEKVIFNVLQQMQRNGMGPSGAQQHGGRQAWTNPDGFNDAVNQFMPQGKWTGTVQDYNDLVANGNLGQQQLSFFEHHLRIANGLVSQSDIGSMFPNTSSVHTMGAASWPNPNQNDPNDPSNMAHSAVGQAYANMVDLMKMPAKDFQAMRSKKVQEDLRAQWNNLSDRPNMPMETISADDAKTRNQQTMDVANEAAASGNISLIDPRLAPDGLTRGFLNKAKEHAKAGRAAEASAAMVEANTASANYAPTGDVETASKIRMSTFDTLFKSLETLAKHLDHTSTSVVGASKTLDDFKNEHDAANAKVRDVNEAVGRARTSGALSGPDGNLSTEGRSIITTAKAIGVEISSQWAEGGSKRVEAEEQLTGKDNEKLGDYISKGGKSGKKGAFAAMTGKLLSGMMAFQLARDIRYTMTPLEQSAEKYDRAVEENAGMMERNGMGFNTRTMGAGTAAIVGADISYGFGKTTSHTMAGVASVGKALGSDGLGSGAIGGLASMALPGVGAAMAVGAIGQMAGWALATTGPLALGLGVTVAGLSGIASFLGANENKVARARSVSIEQKYGIGAANNDDIWPRVANIVSPPDPAQVQASRDIAQFIDPNVGASLVAGGKAPPSPNYGSSQQAVLGKMSDIQRQQYFAEATGSGSRFAIIGNKYGIDKPSQDKIFALTAQRAGDSEEVSTAYYDRMAKLFSEGGDPVSRQNAADTVANSLGVMDAYGGNELALSNTSQINIEAQAKKLNVLGGFQSAHSRGREGYGLADRAGSRYYDNLDTINAMSTDPSLSTQDLLNYAQAPGVWSQINGGWWGAVAAEKNGGPSAQSTFDNLQAFTESGPQTQDVVRESMRQTKLNDYQTLSRGFAQFGGSLGTRTGDESTEQYQSDAQRQQVQSSIVNNAVMAGFDQSIAASFAKSVAPEQLSQYSPQQLADQAGIAAWTTQSPEMKHVSALFNRQELSSSFATAEKRSATMQRISIQGGMLDRAVAAGVNRSAAIANISSVTPDTGQLYTPEELASQMGVDAFNTQSPEMLNAAAIMGRVEPIGSFRSAEVRAATAQRLATGSNMVTAAVMNGSTLIGAQASTDRVNPVTGKLATPYDLANQEGMSAFLGQSPEMKNMVSALGLAPAKEEGLTTPAEHFADLTFGLVTSERFRTRENKAATEQGVKSQYDLMQLGMANNMSSSDAIDFARKYSPLHSTLRTAQQNKEYMGAVGYQSRTPLQKSMEQYMTPQFQAAISPEMFETQMGQDVYGQLMAMTPMSATVGMQQGLVSYGTGSASGLMPAFDLKTGASLFQRSMNGLITAGGNPTNREVSSYFAANSQHIASFTPTGFQGGRDRWAEMGKSAAGISDQNQIINTAQEGGIVGLQELQGAWQTQISNRMEAASIGLSQAGPRLDHAYQLKTGQPYAKMQLDFENASNFGGTVDTEWMQKNGIPAYNAGRGKFAWARESLAIDTENMLAQGAQGMARIGWQIADVNRQQYQFGVTSGWQKTDMNIARGRQQTQNQWQTQEFGFQANEMRVARQSFREDTSYNKEVAGLQYGWKMEDADINIKRSTGFERRQLVKQKGRDTEMFNLEQGHVDVQTKRQEDQFKREDDHFKKQVDHFKTQTKWQDEDFKKEQERFAIQTEWKNNEFNIQRSRAQQEMGWAEEALNRSIKSMQIRKEQLDAEESQAKAMSVAKEVVRLADIENENAKFKLSQQAVVMTQAEKDKMAELEVQIAGMRKDEGDRITALGKLQMTYFTMAIEYLKANGILTPGSVGPVDTRKTDINGKHPGDIGYDPLTAKANGGKLSSGSIYGEAGPEMVVDTNGGTYALPTRHLTPKPYGSSGDVVRVEASIPILLDGKQIAMAIVPIMVNPVAIAQRRSTRRL